MCLVSFRVFVVLVLFVEFICVDVVCVCEFAMMRFDFVLVCVSLCWMASVCVCVCVVAFSCVCCVWCVCIVFGLWCVLSC